MRIKHKVQLHQETIIEVAARLLKRCGLQSTEMPMSGCKFDLLARNTRTGKNSRIEVKVTAGGLRTKNGAIKWQFNLHRHGKKAPGAVDFYVLKIGTVPEFGFKCGLFLIVPARKVENHFSIVISPRQLLTDWHAHVDDWNSITAATV